MENNYNGGLTREQFLFYEIRVLARLLEGGLTKEEAIQQIVENNLFQFPTERMTENIANACYKRYDALLSPQLRSDLATASQDVAKQINLYAMMCYNRLVWDFMVTVIGEKYRTQDLECTPGDVMIFLKRLQEQNDTAASWSDSTLAKLRQVLRKCLVECGYLDNASSTKLNPVYPFDELIDGIKANNDIEALCAFNYFA